jgi:hypothetical protein
MSTVLLSGVGALGSWALELLARSSGVERIITVDRIPWSGPSRTNLAMIGAVFQGHTKAWEHHQVDLADTGSVARLLAETRPDAILHSATMQSPRRLMHATIDSGVRATLRQATFGMWLPWHVVPAARLVKGIEAAGIETAVVNVSFPDVVNVILRNRFGHGPLAGAGNVEVLVAQLVRYLVDNAALETRDFVVSLVGSHALLGRGPEVPHHLHITVAGRDVTDEYDFATMTSWPERIDWSKVDVFSLFAASAVKNVLALLGEETVRTHVSGANGLPGGYPVRISGGRINLDLPAGLSADEAIAINEQAARFDGIESIESDGTVVYTSEAVAAMNQLGLAGQAFGFDELEERAARLSELFERLVTLEDNHA